MVENTLNPKTLPRDTSTKPEASAEEEAPKTLPRDTSTAGLDGTQDLPRHQPEGSTQDLPRHQPEGSTQDLPRHQSDDLELELERLVDELFSDDDPGMDVDDAAPQSPLVLSEKATHLFECLAKAKASSKNWLSPASKSSKNESEPAQSSGSKVGDRRRRSTSSGRDMPENAQRKLRFPPHLNLPKEAIHLSDSD
ncbi:unnamed protein product [Symbiodinium sp. CCMP2592]|nr:unnamed protein product [Symbiodinium sp. CCMP2592]